MSSHHSKSERRHPFEAMIPKSHVVKCLYARLLAMSAMCARLDALSLMETQGNPSGFRKGDAQTSSARSL